MNLNPQKQIIAVDKKGKIIGSVPFGERYTRTKKQAIAMLSKKISAEFEFYETTTSFQKRVERK